MIIYIYIYTFMSPDLFMVVIRPDGGARALAAVAVRFGFDFDSDSFFTKLVILSRSGDMGPERYESVSSNTRGFRVFFFLSFLFSSPLPSLLCWVLGFVLWGLESILVVHLTPILLSESKGYARGDIEPNFQDRREKSLILNTIHKPRHVFWRRSGFLSFIGRG